MTRRAIIIGAGRGERLMPTTADVPKCFAEVGGRRILDWTVEALTTAGIEQIAFIGGYRIEAVQAAYPGLEFRHNVDWPNNNILASGEGGRRVKEGRRLNGWQGRRSHGHHYDAN